MRIEFMEYKATIHKMERVNQWGVRASAWSWGSGRLLWIPLEPKNELILKIGSMVRRWESTGWIPK